MSLGQSMESVESTDDLKVYAAPFKQLEPAEEQKLTKPEEKLEAFCQNTWAQFSALALQKLGILKFLNKELGIDVEMKVERKLNPAELELAQERCKERNEFHAIINLISEMYTYQTNISTIKEVTEGTLYKTHKRLCLLIGLLACTMVHDEEVIEIFNDLSRQIVDEKLQTYEPTDLSFISLCLFLIYKNVKEEELLQEAFILANYANIIDPLGAEILMVTIGEKIIKKYQSYPSLFDSQFVEFVSRRTSTSNTGRMSKESLHIFSTLFLNNHTSNRPFKVENPCKFTEYLKYVSDNPYKSKYYAEELYRFESTKNIEHCYKAIQSVYSEKNTQFHNRACKLGNIYRVAQCQELCNLLDLNERLILLFNSVHNFNVSLNVKKKLINSYNWELSGNKFNVDAFTKTVFNLYNFLLDKKKEIENLLPSTLSIHESFPKILINQLILSLYDMACTLEKEINENETRENNKPKSNSVMVLKERCLNEIVSNITQFLDILNSERKFKNKLETIYHFLLKQNNRFKLIFESEPVLESLIKD